MVILFEQKDNVEHFQQKSQNVTILRLTLLGNGLAVPCVEVSFLYRCPLLETGGGECGYSILKVTEVYRPRRQDVFAIPANV